MNHTNDFLLLQLDLTLPKHPSEYTAYNYFFYYHDMIINNILTHYISTLLDFFCLNSQEQDYYGNVLEMLKKISMIFLFLGI
jgi:hypothetical protein